MFLLYWIKLSPTATFVKFELRLHVDPCASSHEVDHYIELRTIYRGMVLNSILFTGLPQDLLLFIAKYLELADLVNLSQVCVSS
jgi:hypothetical protein